MALGTDSQRPMLKGAMIQSVRALMIERGTIDRVRGALPKDWAHALDGDVFTTDWIDLRVMGAIGYAVAQTSSDAAVTEIVRAVSRTGTIPRIQPIIDGIVRLFGLTPASIFARMSTINRATTRGVETEWVPSGSNAGSVFLRFDGPVDPPSPWSLYSPPSIAAWMGTIHAVFDICDLKGTVTPMPVRDRRIELRAQW